MIAPWPTRCSPSVSVLSVVMRYSAPWARAEVGRYVCRSRCRACGGSAHYGMRSSATATESHLGCARLGLTPALRARRVHERFFFSSLRGRVGCTSVPRRPPPASCPRPHLGGGEKRLGWAPFLPAEVYSVRAVWATLFEQEPRYVGRCFLCHRRFVRPLVTFSLCR